MVFKNPLNEIEAKELLDFLNSNLSITEAELLDLCKIMAKTEYPGIRDLVALKIHDSKFERGLPFLISSIKSNIHTSFISTLIYGASAFDCSKYFQLFIDILILKKDICFVDSYYVITEMENIPFRELNYGLNKLEAFSNIVPRSYKLKNELFEMINLLKSKKREH